MIDRNSYSSFQKYLRATQPDRPYLTSFSAFQILNHKSQFITFQDTFARQLLCIKGLSAEKIGALLRVYPTHQALWQACIEAEERELNEVRERTRNGAGTGRKKKSDDGFKASLFLQDIAGNPTRRIGPALSTKIYELYRKTKYSTEI